MSAHDALTRLSATRRTRSADAERPTAFRLDGHHGDPLPIHEPPLDYAIDEHLPFEARPMFGVCERILIGSIVGLGLLALLFAFGG